MTSPDEPGHGRDTDSPPATQRIEDEQWAQHHPDAPDTEPAADDDRDSPKDDEQLNRESIAETGEPSRDALGNADGAS